ncbi:MAG: RibD family protein [Cyclobacteriaceae bacterium]
MDQTRLLFLQRTINLAQAGFQKSSVQQPIGWIVGQQNHVLSEGWLAPDRSYEAQLKSSLSSIPVSDNTQLFISTNPFNNREALQQLIQQYRIQEVIIAEEIQPLSAPKWFANRRLNIFTTEKRPYIVLKWAQTADGFIARSNHDSKWISGVHARKLVHHWRAQEAAIWVGKNTYRYDNPRLNVRGWVGENPIRIVIDPTYSLPPNLNVFDQSQPTLCYTKNPPASLSNLECIALPDEKSWGFIIPYVLSDLYQRQITSVFVEGGTQLLSFLIEHDYWDEARVFKSKKAFGEGIAAPSLNHEYLISQVRVSEDQLFTYQRFGVKS